MPTVSVSLTPVDRARRRIELPVITAEDSPSRNPCKVRSDGPAGHGRAFRNEPYGFRAVSHLQNPTAPTGAVVPQARRVPTMSALVAPTSDDDLPPPPPQPQQFPGLTGAEQASPPAAQPQRSPEEGSPSPPRPPPTVDSTPPRGAPPAPAPAADEHAPASADDTPVWSGPRPTRFNADQERASSIPPVERRAGSGRRPTAVVVKFKHQDGIFMLPTEAENPDRFAEGDYVVVEGDRGEHVGRIDQLSIQHHHKVNGEVGTVIRRALPEEVELVHRIRMQEPHITRQVQRLADEMDVAMRVVDTEVQTDRNKITIYYVSKVGTPVDFRQLQRRLFREFRCRIWFIDWETL